MEYIRVGVIVKPIGLKGDLKIKSFTDAPKERYQRGNQLYRYDGKEYHKLMIKEAKDYKNSKVLNDSQILTIRFTNYEDINLVESFRAQELFVRKEDLNALEEDEVYYHELMDSEVFEAGAYLGKVEEIIELANQIVLRVVNDKKQLLIPFHKNFILKVDVSAKIIEVKLIEGML